MKSSTQIKLQKRFVEISLSDNRMDLSGSYFSGDPLNKLPIRCSKCDFPDLDFVPQPYFITRSASMTPAEISRAAHGYLLVRPRLKKILEMVAPEQCRFYPTTFIKTAEQTSWLLTVPVNFCLTGVVKKSTPRCEDCGEPLSGHPGTEYEHKDYLVEDANTLAGEIFKTRNWASNEWASARRWGRTWIDRDVVLSLRLYRLLRALKISGIYETGGETKPNQGENDWVAIQFPILERANIPSLPEGTLSSEDKKWFQLYLDKNAGKHSKSIDVGSLEKRHKIKFPKTYLEFVESVGEKIYCDVDDQEGFEVGIHSPEECDFVSYRKGVIQAEDEESRAVNGVMFASTKHGDCFVFDVRKDRKECEVFVYLHEMNSFEPYAANFVECVKRFATRKSG